MHSFSDRALDPSGNFTNFRIPIVRRSKQVDMIRHENGRDDFPIAKFVHNIGKCGECLIVRQDRAPISYAKREKINDRLIVVQPYRDPRRMSHAARLARQML